MRTRQQALKHILAEYKAKRLGAMDSSRIGCAYEEGIRHCVVGCLFTPAQHADIKARNLNSGTSVSELIEEFGIENIEAVTGLCEDELEKLQEMHDDEYGDISVGEKGTELYEYLKKHLERA